MAPRLFARLAYLDQRKQEFLRQRGFRATSELVRGYMVFRRERLILNSEIELKIMRHFLLVGRISEKLAEANVRDW